MSESVKSKYSLSKSERVAINRIAHKRTKSLPSYMYQKEYKMQRERLYVQFRMMLEAGHSFEVIEALTQSNHDKKFDEIIKMRNHILSLK